jgi:exodeoxyribonuclease VII small subunit
MKKSPRRQPSFEKKLQQLEHIVSEIEAEGVTLETLLKKYQEGQALLIACQEELDRAEMAIQTFKEASTSGGDKERISEVPKCP